MCDQQRLRSACAYAQSDQSLCKPLEYSISVKLQVENHLEFLRLKRGCTGSSEYTLVKIPHCWKSFITGEMLASSCYCRKVSVYLHQRRWYKLCCHLCCGLMSVLQCICWACVLVSTKTYKSCVWAVSIQTHH